MKKIFSFSCFLFFVFPATCFSFVAKGDTARDRDWRIEAEPSSFVFRGYNLHVSRNITADNNLNIGLYTLALDIPKAAQKKMFNNVPESVDVRLGFEIALVTRYKIRLGKRETNPYVGLVTGWEYFDLKNTSTTDLRITTGVITPFGGYEIYLFRQMIFVNPQMRAVIYVAPKNSQANRSESMKPFFLLPAISVGIRL